MTIPDWITQDMAASAIGEVGEKHRRARLGDIHLTTLSEGRCVQTPHIGSYDDEAGLLGRMHHEIYLSDPRKVAPDKFRTILRQPVERAQPRHAGSPPMEARNSSRALSGGLSALEDNASWWPLSRLGEALGPVLPSARGFWNYVGVRCRIFLHPGR